MSSIIVLLRHRIAIQQQQLWRLARSQSTALAPIQQQSKDVRERDVVQEAQDQVEKSSKKKRKKRRTLSKRVTKEEKLKISDVLETLPDPMPSKRRFDASENLAFIAACQHSKQHQMLNRFAKNSLINGSDSETISAALSAILHAGEIKDFENILKRIPNLDDIALSRDLLRAILLLYSNKCETGSEKAAAAWPIIESHFKNESRVTELVEFAHGQGSFETVVEQLCRFVPQWRESAEFCAQKCRRNSTAPKVSVGRPRQPNNVVFPPSFDIESIPELVTLQLQVEQEAFAALPSFGAEGMDTAEKNREKYRSIVSDLQKKQFEMWRKQIRKRIMRIYGKQEKKFQRRGTVNPLPFLSCLDAEADICEMLMLELKHIFSHIDQLSYTERLTRIQAAIQQRYFQQLFLSQFGADNIRQFYIEFYRAVAMNEQSSTSSHYDLFIELSRQHNIDFINIQQFLLPRRIARKFARSFYSILIDNLSVYPEQYHRFLAKGVAVEQAPRKPLHLALYYSNGRLQRSIAIDPLLRRLFIGGDVSFTDLPMLLPPMPWLSDARGGYLLKFGSVMRRDPLASPPLHDSTSSSSCLPSDTKNLIDFSLLRCLDQIAATPWTLSSFIVEHVLNLFRNGGDWENLAIAENVTQSKFKLPDKSDLAERQAMKKRRREMYSLWCTDLYRISVAKHFESKIIWQPMNIDFRGRVYPIPSALNHIGNDVTRSMFRFAIGKPLGDAGLKWLKVHLVNQIGNNKRSSNLEREKYCEEVLDDVIDSAENPFTGRRFWMEADEPWQCLAACRELTDALRSSSPKDFRSHLPVYQDGSCNGLQHYAALGRDEDGARSVNLIASERPEDVYSDMLRLVEEKRRLDALADCNSVASRLEGLLERRIVKQTIMTLCYGVTRYGATLQIKQRLKEIDCGLSPDIIPKVSAYLAASVFECVATKFTSARLIQYWLTQSAAILSSKSSPLQWKTPLGLTVEQAYFKRTKSGKERPDKRKQKNSIAPNFVHSIDATHMFLTAKQCHAQSITFGAVHDSFWTHASDVEAMGEICRREFVELHRLPLLERLSEEFVSLYDAQGGEDEQQRDQLIKVFGAQQSE